MNNLYCIADKNGTLYSFTSDLEDLKKNFKRLDTIYPDVRILKDVTDEVMPDRELLVSELFGRDYKFHVIQGEVTDTLHLVCVGMDEYKLFSLKSPNCRWSDVIFYGKDKKGVIIEVLMRNGYFTVHQEVPKV